MRKKGDKRSTKLVGQAAGQVRDQPLGQWWRGEAGVQNIRSPVVTLNFRVKNSWRHTSEFMEGV